MFPIPNNQFYYRAVKNALEAGQEQFTPTDCRIKALKLFEI